MAWVISAGLLQDMAGKFLQVLFKFAGHPVKVQCPGGELGAEVTDADLPWWCGAVVLAVDEHAFGQVQSGGVGEDLVVVGFAAESAAGDFVFGVGD